MNCTNCATEITTNFCANCGQAKSLKRIDAHYIVHEIEHILHFERGILYTIRELAIHPGKNIRKYLSENRSRLVKPIIFIIITSLIYTLFTHFFHIDDSYVKYHEVKKSSVTPIIAWLQGHYGYANILMGVFIAWWLKLFFRKSYFNFYETLILLCFVMGMGMLIFSLFVIFQGITHINVMTLAGVIAIIYSTWAIGQFFEQKKFSSYFKALAAYILGMITFWLIPLLIGTTVDLFIKH